MISPTPAVDPNRLLIEQESKSVDRILLDPSRRIHIDRFRDRVGVVAERILNVFDRDALVVEQDRA